MKLKPGIYRHYKVGNLYRVIEVAKHSETLEDMVFYEVLHENDLSRFWVRPLKMFTEEVIAPDGTKKRRFAFVSDK